MTKQTRAKLVTGLLAAALVAFVAGRESGWDLSRVADAGPLRSSSTPEAEKPQDAIYRMLDAMRDGDGDAYIGCHSGEMAKRLGQSREEMTGEGFAEYLRTRNREIKGIAINQPEMASERQARVRVEYVYEDRNEAQQVHLQRIDGRWMIAGVDGAQRVKTLVPYGTPVY